MMSKGTPVQLRAKRTRRQLLDAARRVFAEQGFAAATVDDVCRSAGCSKGAFYFHFGSKEEALLALADRWIAERTRRLRKAGGQPTAFLAALSAPDDAGLAFQLWHQADATRALREMLARAYQGWRAILRASIARSELDGTVDARALADALLVVADGLAVRRRITQAGAATTEDVSNLILHFAAPRTLEPTG